MNAAILVAFGCALTWLSRSRVRARLVRFATDSGDQPERADRIAQLRAEISRLQLQLAELERSQTRSEASTVA